jgi:hypothetical protein
MPLLRRSKVLAITFTTAEKTPRPGEPPRGLTSDVRQGAGFGVRLGPNDAATLVPWP